MLAAFMAGDEVPSRHGSDGDGLSRGQTTSGTWI